MSPELRALLSQPHMPVVTKVTHGQLVAMRKDILRRMDAIVNALHSGDDWSRITMRVTKLVDDLGEIVLDQLLPITEEDE